MSSDNQFYEAGQLGGHGNDYQRQVAWLLLQRLILDGKHFKLGFEVTAAGKFDDVAVFYDDAWHLIQTKHCLPTKEETITDLKKEMLFKISDEAFSLLRYVKSYYTIRKTWKHGPIKHVILLTNRNLDTSFDADSFTEVEQNKLLKLSKDILPIQLIGKQGKRKDLEEKMMQILKAEAFKRDFDQIKEAMIKLFQIGAMNDILTVYNTYLKQMLTEADTVRLVEEKQFENPDLTKLYRELKQKLKNKSVPKAKMQTFWNESKDAITTDISKETVAEFFNKFLLAVSQPNVEELKQAMINEGRLWMREWIRPDNLGKVNQSFFGLPWSVISNEFHGYEMHSTKRDHNGVLKTGKLFLQNRDGEVILNKIKEKINIEIEKVKNHSCANLESIRYYYINRKITLSFPNQENEIVIFDSEFAKTNLTNSDEHKFFVLTAQPGMGKSTLMQYLAFEAQKGSDNAVFLIYLNNLRADLPWIENIHDLSNKNVFQSELSSDNVEIIVNNNETQIILFFDAFDELSERNQTKVLQLIDVLLKKSNVKVVVSGRRNVREKLVDKHHAISIAVQAFDRGEKNTFLSKYWKKSVDDEGKFNQFANHLLNQLDKGISNREQELIGIPLMLRMVAEVYEGPFEKYLNSETVDVNQFITGEKLTILCLYDRFGTKCIQRTMNKNYNVNDSFEPGSMFNPLIEAINYDYQVFAVKCIIKYWGLYDFVTNKKYHKTLQSFKNRISNEQSLIVEIVAKRPKFTHLSFAEYFAAKYLFNSIIEMEICLCKDGIFECFESRENICIFFLTIIDSHIPKESSNIHDCLNNFPKLSTNFQRLLLNLGHKFVFLSCAYNFPRIVKYLYDLHRPFTFENIRDADGKTVLEVATLKRAQNVRNVLHDIFKQNGSLKNPLHFAVESNCTELVQHYVDLQINVNVIDENECTALSRTKCDKILNVLLSKGANVNSQNQKGETLLHIATRKGRFELVKMLVEKKALIDIKSHDNKTPLDIACEEFHPKIVQFLLTSLQSQNLNQQLNIEFQGVFTASLLQLYKIFDRRHTKKQCIDHLKNLIDTNLLIGGDLNPDEGNKALLLAARLNASDVIEKLLEKNADVNYQGYRRYTPLHFAAEFGSHKVVKLLVDRFNDFTLTNNDKDTVLHCAARNNDSKCLELLIGKFKTFSLSLELTNDWFINQRYTPLETAISKGIEKNIQLLVEAGANFIKLLDPNYPFFKKFRSNTMFRYFVETAVNSSLQKPEHLIAAARVGCDKSVQLLIKAAVDVNVMNISKRTALHYAAKYRHHIVVKLLLKNGAEVNHKDKNGHTALHMALKVYDKYGVRRYVPSIKYDEKNNNQEIYNIYNSLVSAGANEKLIDNDKNTVLHFASRAGGRELVKCIIDKKIIDINCKNRFGCTALHNAAKVEHEEIIKLLISNGANINVRDNKGKTPLHEAITRSNPEAVRCLLKYSPQVDLSQYKQLLQQNLNEERIRTLLEIGGDINSINEFGQTFLHALFETRQIEKDFFKFLIEAGIDVDAVDDEGNTALHYAANGPNIYYYTYLIDLSTKINHQNKKGETPLHTAIKCSYNIDYLRLLITKNACINLADNEENTPLHLLISKKKNTTELTLHLIEHCPELNRQNKKGETVLHLAVCENDYPMVEKLVEKGADLTLKTIEGKTALDVAKDKQYQKIYEYLLEAERKSILKLEEVSKLQPASSWHIDPNSRRSKYDKIRKWEYGSSSETEQESE